MENPNAPAQAAPIPPPQLEAPPPVQQPINLGRAALGMLAMLVAIPAVPSALTGVVWALLWGFGLSLPWWPLFASVVAFAVAYTFHLAMLSRAVRPLTKV